MNKQQIDAIFALRDIRNRIHSAFGGTPSRASSLALDKIDEAVMWLKEVENE